MDNRGRSSAMLDVESGGRSITDVLKDIGENIQQIVRSEIKLARIEMTESARGARSAAISFGTGGVLGLFGLGFLLLTVMFALELVLPNWLAALIVGVGSLIVAAIGISAGRKSLKTIKAPKKTIETVKEDLQWTKEQTKL